MSRVKYSILVVDDEAAQRQLLSTVLEKDYAVVTAADGREAMRLLEQRSFDLIITDERMPGMSGIDLIQWVREQASETPIIVLTAYGSIETAVEAIKLGAQDYLTKPLKSPDELRLVVAKALGERTLRDQSLIHQAESDAAFPPDIIAESEAMRQVLTLAAQVAPQPATVLLTGESGTGKEVIARFIHRRSPRADGPFVAVNCAALTETLLESELFGHEKGAFTGASQTKRGRFELAHGGTLFLDEIAEMSVNLQAKLLRVLQEQQFERVGGTRTITVDVRVIAATNKNLVPALEEKTFREDLYYRLSVFPIHIPPLRERREDILPLAEYLVRKISGRMGQSPKPLNAEVRQALYHYHWPGNVRELQNALERALIVSKSNVILSEDLPLPFSTDARIASQPATLADIEKAAILEALARNQGNRHKTAEELGISLRTLQYRLKEYGLTERE
ncbi:MAG: sigma-54-dependent Fis family transcriptional regulator [Acidobacteria bacterium]|nr:sigma-54-dependent Fis family transcriptional regulator [Acidobacteriota bacterium]